MRAFLRFPRLRRLYLAWISATAPSRSFDLGHLARFQEAGALGPVQREEALLLFSLVRVLRPLRIVEFGFHRGHSALNFLLALPAGAELHSYDIEVGSEEIASRLSRYFPQLRFHLKDQRLFDPSDVGDQAIDVVLLDGAHDVEANQQTFLKIAPHVADGGLIAVHDTGAWARTFMSPEHHEWASRKPDRWLDAERYLPWPEERRFVTWILDFEPEWSQIHLHSERTLRHGLTLLQKRRRLPVVEVPDAQ